MHPGTLNRAFQLEARHSHPLMVRLRPADAEALRRFAAAAGLPPAVAARAAVLDAIHNPAALGAR
jgi:hypothetical protein